MPFGFNLEESYPLYTMGHISQIISMIVLFIIAFFAFRNKKSIENKVYLIATIICHLCVIGITIYSVSTGIFNIEWILPLHLCNLFFIILPIMSFSKGKTREFLKDYAFYIGMGGCILYVLIPANTQVYFDAWHVVPVLCHIHHVTIGLVSVYLLSSGVYKPRVKNFWKMFAVLVPLIIGAAICNALLGTNFCFMNPGRQTYPLAYIGTILGEYYPYLILSAILVIPSVSMLILYGIKKKSQVKINDVLSKLSVITTINKNNLWKECLNDSFIENINSNSEFIEYKKEMLSLLSNSDQSKVTKKLYNKIKHFNISDFIDKDDNNIRIQILKLIKYFIRYIRLKHINTLVSIISRFPEHLITEELNIVHIPYESILGNI